MNHNPQRDAAVAATERGWSIFPLAAGRKLPALHGADRCPGPGTAATGTAPRNSARCRT